MLYRFIFDYRFFTFYLYAGKLMSTCTNLCRLLTVLWLRMCGIVCCFTYRSASRAEHAGAVVSAARSARSHRLSSRVQSAAHGRRLVQGRSNARLPDRAARQGQQTRHAHSTSCDIVGRGAIFLYAVLAARSRPNLRSRPSLRSWSASQPTVHSLLSQRASTLKGASRAQSN